MLDSGHAYHCELRWCLLALLAHASNMIRRKHDCQIYPHPPALVDWFRMALPRGRVDPRPSHLFLVLCKRPPLSQVMTKQITTTKVSNKDPCQTNVASVPRLVPRLLSNSCKSLFLGFHDSSQTDESSLVRRIMSKSCRPGPRFLSN
jgi:hypothetical protein